MTARRTLVILAIVGLMLGGLALGHFVYRTLNGEAREGMGGPVVLPSTQGEFRLSALEEDQVAVIFFGYTSCPDVCPMSLANMRQALAQLPAEARGRVVPVFISVDPERDSLARLKAYVEHFGPTFVGATGAPQALEEIGERYGVVWRRVPAQGDAESYSVDHSGTTFIVDPQGHILEQVIFSPAPYALREALARALAL
ncbi:SCO family protein [Halomonas sp. WWR20]